MVGRIVLDPSLGGNHKVLGKRNGLQPRLSAVRAFLDTALGQGELVIGVGDLLGVFTNFLPGFSDWV